MRMGVFLYQGAVIFACMLVVCGMDWHAGRCNVSGVWGNGLGSVLSLSSEGLQLTGLLRSAVESSRGAAGGERIGKVVGVLGDGEQPTFAMSVSWTGGSVSTWAGQCFRRSDGTVLRTMWLLRSAASSEVNSWKATRVGEDTFYPQKGTSAPEKLSCE
ncbi:avidin-related protein 4/5-like [Ascaphus truei]|uniref:avidin-related protein 4/5-like n=1 Tax=Ascaphus truei TaxID=8439 RepID=UPI003F59F00B